MSSLPSTVAELTGSQYKELKYNLYSNSDIINGEYVTTICSLLNKCGISVSSTTEYGLSVETAVKKFQKIAGLNQTGILNNATWQTLVLYSDKMSDTVSDDSTTDSYSSDEKSTSPHFNSFFDEDNYKTTRINHQDIKIVFGNKSITKTIKDVYMRSVTVEVDTSGNPISEIYEFIAKDIIESDELKDLNKYTKDEDYTSSDVKYTYLFGTTE